MTTLVLGATGATGRLLVRQLLDRQHEVRAIVRSPDRLPATLRDHERLSLTRASLLELGDSEIARHVEGCSAVASCLGHTVSWRGIYGHPRRLVTEATRRVCAAIRAQAPTRPTRFVLMNTTANRNRDLPEPVSIAQRCVLALLRILVPPHADNEAAADFLRTEVGPRDPAIEWVAVRPDGLIDEDVVTEYDVHPSPIRSAIFNAGQTSRIHVAHFMAELITDGTTWDRWKGQMPVIYNATGHRGTAAATDDRGRRDPSRGRS
ncbi:MAG: SDR family oxidoreductase [Candidatus Eiseniibacteriota bacterium]|jgi:nucleoside-diphosphate-sugar epimerase